VIEVHSACVVEERDPDRDRDIEEIDRAAILARRRRFIVAALGGLAGVGACAGVEPPPPGPPEDFETSAEPVLSASLVEAPSQTPPEPVEPAPAKSALSVEELRAILAEPGLDLCVDDRLGDIELAAPDEQREELAKALYLRGLRAQEEGDFTCALDMFETAYYLVPGKHRFAFLVGESAFAVGECAKARDYLEHFVVYADPDKDAERLQKAAELLDTPELLACERPPAPPEYDESYPAVCLSPSFEPDPEPESKPPPLSPREQRRAEREQRRASKMFRPRKRR
jgi:hypothetical protein